MLRLLRGWFRPPGTVMWIANGEERAEFDKPVSAWLAIAALGQRQR